MLRYATPILFNTCQLVSELVTDTCIVVLSYMILYCFVLHFMYLDLLLPLAGVHLELLQLLDLRLGHAPLQRLLDGQGGVAVLVLVVGEEIVPDLLLALEPDQKVLLAVPEGFGQLLELRRLGSHHVEPNHLRWSR